MLGRQAPAVKEVQLIAVYVIPQEEKKNANSHFSDSARSLCEAVMLYELAIARADGRLPPSISDILSAVTNVKRTITEYLQQLVEYEGGNANIAKAIRETAYGILQTDSKEFTSILSSLRTPLSVFRDPILAEATSVSDFKISDLVDEKTPMTLYLTIRPSDRDRLKHYFSLFINLMFRKLTSEEAEHIGVRHELLILLEEFTSLPTLDVVQQSMDVMRGFKLKAFIVLQDVESLYARYGNNETFTSNSKVQIAYTPSKSKTAQLISDMVGTETVQEKTSSRQKKPLSFLPSENESESLHSRKLMTPDEVTRLKIPTLKGENKLTEPGEALVFVRGCKPIRCWQTPYFFDEELRRRAAIPPPEPEPRSEKPMENRPIDYLEEEDAQYYDISDKLVDDLEMLKV